MPKGLQRLLEEGVIYHAFSDQSGLSLYSTFSNEVIVVALSERELLDAFDSAGPVSDMHYSFKQELCKKGFIKREWH